MHHGCRVVVAAIATLAATLAVAQSAAGAIVASPSSLTFPDTAVGAESTLAVTFTNTDPTASYLSVFSTSPVGGDFTLGSTDCPFPLPGGATCQYTIRFTPSSVGMKSGTFSWATTNGESEGSVALSGVGVMPPIVSFGPAPAFPDQRIDEPGPVRTVTVTNTGDQDLVVSSVGLIGADASAFELVSQDCTAAPAPASGSCEMSLRFAPATAGAKSASLRLVSNALASPSDLALSATGLTPPQVSFGPAPSFPDQVVGWVGPDRTVTLSNAGEAPLTVTAVSLLGAEAGDFQLVDESCTVAPIAGGGDCQVTLRFAPTSAGVKSATLRVASDAPAGIDELALSASAFVISGAPAPVLAGISPDHGSAGAVVMLEGSWLGGVTRVLFGDRDATEVEPLGFDRVRAIVPDGPAGSTVDVRVISPGGASQPLPFTYHPAPPPPVAPPEARTCTVPDLAGATRRWARRTLRAAGCRLGRVRRTADAPRRRAVVIGQSRRAGRVLPADTRVDVRLGRAERRTR